jgi:hypothetical protein
MSLPTRDKFSPMQKFGYLLIIMESTPMHSVSMVFLTPTCLGIQHSCYIDLAYLGIWLAPGLLTVLNAYAPTLLNATNNPLLNGYPYATLKERVESTNIWECFALLISTHILKNIRPRCENSWVMFD